jgi:hypothetical protein
VRDEPAWLLPTRLELLADELGVGPEEPRQLLRREIEQRQQRDEQPATGTIAA